MQRWHSYTQTKNTTSDQLQYYFIHYQQEKSYC